MYLKIFNLFLHLIFLLLVLLSVTYSVTGHIDTPCQHLVVHNFTPCFNLLTGSSADGSSPTTECCSELNKLSHSDVDCACQVLIGTLPAQLTFLSSLQVVLPRCNMPGVPIQCKAYGTPQPAPGPALWSPRDHPPEAAAPSPSGSPGLAPTPLSVTPVGAETPRPAAAQQIQQLLNPASDGYLSSRPAIYTLWCLIASVTGFMGY